MLIDNIVKPVYYVVSTLDNASLNNMLEVNSDEFDPDELCRYAKDILSELDIPELDTFISELSEIDDAW